MSTSTFNLVCKTTALLWLATVLPLTQVFRPTYDDFNQYYLAGVCAAEHRWDLLYPIPKPGALGNAGQQDNSDPKPQYSQLAAQRGVPNAPFHFIQFPAIALFMWPLDWFNYPNAHWLWLILSQCCAALIALQAGYILKQCLGRPTPFSGLLTLVIAVSPMIYRGVRVSNMTPFVAAILGYAVVQLSRRDAMRSGGAIATTALTKYIGAILIPVAIALGQWKTILYAILFSLITIALSLCIAGTPVHAEFFTRILPTLGRSAPFRDNQSLQGFLIRNTKHYPLPIGMLLAVHLLQAIVLFILLALIISRRKQLQQSTPMIFAASAALLAWMMLFSPICWDHYLLYLFPFWGWLAWEAMQSRALCVASLTAMAIALISTASSPLKMPEPFNSHLMASVILVLSIGLSRLIRGVGETSHPPSTVANESAPLPA